MNQILQWNKFLKLDIQILEIFVYFISSIIIFMSIVYAMYTSISHFDSTEKSIYEAKIQLSNIISFVLSLILCIEILKIYFVKTYKQLIIVATLVILKLTINYFLSFEIDDAKEKIKN